MHRLKVQVATGPVDHVVYRSVCTPPSEPLSFRSGIVIIEAGIEPWGPLAGNSGTLADGVAASDATTEGGRESCHWQDRLRRLPGRPLGPGPEDHEVPYAGHGKAPGPPVVRPEAPGAIFQAVDGSPHLKTSHMPAPRVPTLRKVHNRTWSSHGDTSDGVGDRFQPSGQLHFARDRQDRREPGGRVRFRPVAGSGVPEPDGAASGAHGCKEVRRTQRFPGRPFGQTM